MFHVKHSVARYQAGDRPPSPKTKDSAESEALRWKLWNRPSLADAWPISYIADTFPLAGKTQIC